MANYYQDPVSSSNERSGLLAQSRVSKHDVRFCRMISPMAFAAICEYLSNAVRLGALASILLVIGCARSALAPVPPTAGSSSEHAISVPSPAPKSATAAPAVTAVVAPDPCGNVDEADAMAGDGPVTFHDFTAAFGQQLDQLDATPVRDAFQSFARERGLDPDAPGLFVNYARLRILFEAVRDGGYWRLRWDITNQEPSAVGIWHAWQKQPLDETFGHAMATAECDEISALYALLARRIGVDRVGLFYPTWNHTIAAWTCGDVRHKHRLVLVPTTQIFLGCNETFDTTAFKTQMTSIEPYPRWDIRDDSPIPRNVAKFLLDQVRVFGPTSLELQALLRARRAYALKSSVGKCSEYRAELGQWLRGKLTCADRRALRYFAAHELQRPDMSDAQLLEFLTSP
jgi:hypothetical protein